MPPGLRALALCALAAAAAARCSLPADTTVAVYADSGAGENSVAWTRAFFSWLAAANPALKVGYVADAREIAAYPAPDACALARLPSLKLWVQPGGSADNQSTALGPGGRDNILDFADSARGHVLATCAGFYLFAGSYWWFDQFYPLAWAPHFFPTGEGAAVGRALSLHPLTAPRPFLALLQSRAPSLRSPPTPPTSPPRSTTAAPCSTGAAPRWA